MSEERLQKVLARAGVASRRKVEELISQGLVTVNGQVATLGDRADLEKDAVKVDGKRIHPMTAPHLYLLLHKPSGVMSTVSDPEGRETLLDLVPPALHKGLVPVGRLDFMTTGLILLTTDGDFAHRVAHPRYGCTKTYEVKVKGHPDAVALRRLREGIAIEGRKTAPAEVEHRPLPKAVASEDNSWWTVRLTEGRTRQVREMFLRVGHPVLKLRRVAIGTVRDDHLPQGKLRELTDKEVESLRKGAKGEERSKRPKKPPAKRKGRGKGQDAARSTAPADRSARHGGPAKRKGPGKPEDGRRSDSRDKGSAGRGPGGNEARKSGNQRSGSARPGSARPGSAKPGGRPGSGKSSEPGSRGTKPGGKGPGGRGPGSRGPGSRSPGGKGPGSKGTGSKGTGSKEAGRKNPGGKSPGRKGPGGKSRGGKSSAGRGPGNKGQR